MYCPKCGKLLPDDAQYCDACGMRFVQEPQTPPELIYEQPKRSEPEQKPEAVPNAFRKWIKDQGLFCLIAKAVAVTVMTVYLLIAFVSLITLIVQGYPGGTIFTDFIQKLLAGIIYGVIIWLLSDAVLYLGKLYEMKKKETKN